MSKTQKIIFICLAIIAFVATGTYLLRGYLHKPTVDTVDTLQAYIEHRKASADSNENKAKESDGKYKTGLSGFNNPADSVERESVWAKYHSALPKDANGKITP